MQYLQSNTTLQGGKYRIERVLGQGGFGITYLAENVSQKELVAIKEFFMKDFCSRDADTRTMTSPSTERGNIVELYQKKFVKEAQNLSKLCHPNIINVIEVFEENGTVYYSMPYLSGGSLYDLVKSQGCLSESEAMNYVCQIAEALKYMHEKMHICHYDVKPSNILLDESGKAVLIDFGISKNYDVEGHETSTTPIGLSEGYAPIEQYQQNVKEFSPASDVYSLGATLYYLLYAKHPSSAILRANGTPLLLDKNTSPCIRDVIISAMKIPQKERAQDVNVFLNYKYDRRDRQYRRVQFIAGSIVIFFLSFSLLSFFYVNIPYVFENEIDNFSEESCESACCEDEEIIEEVESPDPIVNVENIHLKGSVADVGFSMQLRIQGSEVEGSEHYDNQDSKAMLVLKGIINQAGSMILTEYDGSKRCGTYRGIFNSDSYIGTFTNHKGKNYSFTSTIMDDNRKAEIKEFYSSLLDQYNKQYDDWWEPYPSYFLYDITRDGVPDLWLLVPSDEEHELDVRILVYSSSDNFNCIYNGVLGHPSHNSLHQGKDYVLKWFAHMGSSYWVKYKYVQDSIQEEVIFSQENVESSGEYRCPSEPDVKLFKLSNKQPVNDICL